ncbi:MAG: class I SAM-dependent methyltransferase [Spongiibacteraceae bacterium]
MGTLNPEDWSQYWEGSTITTFQGLFENNYSNEIYNFWKNQITKDCSKILDIACGNGALSWLANDILKSLGVQAKITGIDFADIDPFKRLGRKKSNYPNISFIANTPIENIPIEDSSIDLIISQYGIEYSDLNRTIPEVARILMSKGKLCLVMHIEDSALVKTETRMMQVCRSVLDEDRLHDKYLELDQLYRSTPDNTHPEIQRLKIEIHHLTYQVRRKIGIFRDKADLDNYLYRMEKVFSENTPRRSNKREKAILLAVNELRAYTNRLEDLAAAARSPSDIDDLIKLLAQNNLMVTEKTPIYLNGNELCGLSLVAIKY